MRYTRLMTDALTRVRTWLHTRLARPALPTRPGACPLHGATLWTDEIAERVYCIPHPDNFDRPACSAWPAAWPVAPETDTAPRPRTRSKTSQL